MGFCICGFPALFYSGGKAALTPLTVSCCFAAPRTQVGHRREAPSTAIPIYRNHGAIWISNSWAGMWLPAGVWQCLMEIFSGWCWKYRLERDACGSCWVETTGQFSRNGFFYLWCSLSWLIAQFDRTYVIHSRAQEHSVWFKSKINQFQKANIQKENNKPRSSNRSILAIPRLI